MTNFPFDDGIPAANNNPSNDQPLMLSNNASTNGILDVDHISFEQDNGGTHRKMTFYQNTSPFVPGGSTESQIYPSVPGVGEQSTSSIPKFINFSGTYVLNCVKVFGSFVTAAGPAITPVNSSNVVSITRSGATYIVALTANAVVGTSACYFATTVSSLNGATASLAANTLTITPGSVANGQTIFFAILQV